MKHDPVISLLGTAALLLEAPGETALPMQQKIWALSKDVVHWPEVLEAVPGMNNLMICFKRPPADPQPFINRLKSAWLAVEPLTVEGRTIALPVIYGGEAGPHIGDVVAHTGLSVEEIAEIHSAPLYPVYALGSHPGYCYLGGMDPRIATPRRKTPVLKIPGGAVSIGGFQTGVSASDGPSGWNTIGSTTMKFFDVNKNPPTLLQPGDMIRFTIEKVVR
jgi:KipI family sensor histidine kinase inhibitor